MNRYEIILKKPTRIQLFVDMLVEESKTDPDKTIQDVLNKMDLVKIQEPEVEV
jgi:hypothetical protein